MISNRISKEQYYLNIAIEVASRGTCLRRNSGAVIVKNDQIISTGYTGSARGLPNCIEVGYCIRNQLGYKPGEGYDVCHSVHAEENAIIQAPRDLMIGSKLFLSTVTYDTKQIYVDSFCCNRCKRMVINAGIVGVYINRLDTFDYYPISIFIADLIKLRKDKL